MIWNATTIYLTRKLNRLTSWIQPPPAEIAEIDPATGKRRQRNVLVVQCHPLADSFNAAIGKSVVQGLLEAGHNVRVRQLYDQKSNNETFIGDKGDTESRLTVSSYTKPGESQFQPALTSDERANYYKLTPARKAATTERDTTFDTGDVVINQAIKDLKWCDSIVFVYPTWIMNVPGALKGYLDRIMLPGIVFTFPTEVNKFDPLGVAGLVPQLTNIDKIGVVTTFGATQPVVLACGDNGRRMIARAFRGDCHPECLMSWHGLYASTKVTTAEREQFLKQVKTDYTSF